MAALTIQRIMKEKKELEENPPEMMYLYPLEEDMFEWHFTLMGAPESDYEGGLYHGRVILPKQYPLTPPDIIFMTPSGRFEVGTKICLSVTKFHPEAWSPAWTLRGMMEALLAFMAVDEQGIGALLYSRDERKKIALESRNYQCPSCLAKLKQHEETIISKRGITEERRQKQNRERLQSQSLLKEAQARELQEVEDYFLKKSLSEAPVTIPSQNPDLPILKHTHSVGYQAPPQSLRLPEPRTNVSFSSVTHSIPHSSGMGEVRGVFGAGPDPRLLKAASEVSQIPSNRSDVHHTVKAETIRDKPKQPEPSMEEASMMDEPKTPSRQPVPVPEEEPAQGLPIRQVTLIARNQAGPGQAIHLRLSPEQIQEALRNPTPQRLHALLSNDMSKAEELIQKKYLEYVEEVNRLTFNQRAAIFDSLEGIVTEAVQLESVLQSVTFEDNEKLKEEKEREKERRAAIAASKRAQLSSTHNASTSAPNGGIESPTDGGQGEPGRVQDGTPTQANPIIQSEEYRVLERKLLIIDTVFYGLIAAIILYFLHKLVNLCSHMW